MRFWSRFWRRQKPMSKFKVHYELRAEDSDDVLEKGAVEVTADPNYAFSVAAKNVLDGLKRRERAGVYVACTGVTEVKP